MNANAKGAEAKASAPFFSVQPYLLSLIHHYTVMEQCSGITQQKQHGFFIVTSQTMKYIIIPVKT